MEEVYQAHGIEFRYPSDWNLGEERSENEISISVASSETSFWSLTLFFDSPRPEDLIESALDAFRGEYDEFDIYPTEAEWCRQTSVACELEFVCLELLNSAFLWAFRTENFSALVLYQGTDQELVETKEILQEISASLQWEGGESLST